MLKQAQQVVELSVRVAANLCREWLEIKHDFRASASTCIGALSVVAVLRSSKSMDLLIACHLCLLLS